MRADNMNTDNDKKIVHETTVSNDVEIAYELIDFLEKFWTRNNDIMMPVGAWIKTEL